MKEKKKEDKTGLLSVVKESASQCDPTLGHIYREKHGPKGFIHPNFHCSTVYKSQDKEAT